jgi:FlaA1/EpsC-like NDP-sugar epimerase
MMMLAGIARRASTAVAARCAAVLCSDALATCCGVQLAYLIRFDGKVPPLWDASRRAAIPALIAIRLAMAVVAQLHRWSFRRSGMPEALRLFAATGFGSAMFVLLTSRWLEPIVPRSIYVLEFFITTSLMAAFRFAPHVAWIWYAERARARGGAPRTLIVGAGEAAGLLARDLRRSATSKYSLVGFVDDDEAKIGTRLEGRPVLGRLRDLARFIAAYDVRVVFLAITAMSPARIRELLDLCSSCRARFKIIPASFTALDARITAAMLHDLSPEDLLPRAVVAFEQDEIQELVSGRSVLVTGAAGSIGSEIARQLAAHGARALVLLDMNENGLYLLTRRLSEDHPDVEVHAVVADIRDAAQMHRIGERYRPEYVVHAAAHKHVPLMEDVPEEAIKNNVFGTLHVARMAMAAGARRFVLISTDKAANPSSIMGASKRVAELIVRELAGRTDTLMTAVRFGNVLGSAGSVVPIFKQQIERGLPVTVTDPECTRYFMTISEAVGLVLIAGLRAYGELCVLEMGEPMKIVDLARRLITMAGRVPGHEIPIVYTGLRPGEKLHEEALTEDEEQTLEVHDRIRVARSPSLDCNLWRALASLRRLVDTGDREALRAMILELVPTYRVTTNEEARPATSAANRDGDALRLGYGAAGRPRGPDLHAPPAERQDAGRPAAVNDDLASDDEVLEGST